MQLDFGHVKCGYHVESKTLMPKWIQQVHGNTICEVTEDRRPLAPIPEADAVYTKKKDLAVHVTTADCLPILLYDRNPQGPVAAVHCGWRGAVFRIAEKVRKTLSSPDLEVVIGPAILPCCFEVREDCISTFKREKHPIENFLETRNQKIYLDLPRLVLETQLSGVKANLDLLRCTMCSLPKLPSFRRDHSTEVCIRSWIQKG